MGVGPLLQAGYLNKQQLPYLIAVLALLGVFNGWTQGVWSRPSELQEERLLVVQLLVDVLAASGLLFVTGSANNPFVFVLGVHAFLGGILLRKRKSFFFFVTVLALLAILQIETYQDAQLTVGIENRSLFFNFLAQWILVTVSWFIAFLFSKILQNQEERIRKLQERQFKLDRLKSLGALTAGFSHQMATPLNALQLRLGRALRKSAESSTIVPELHQAEQSLNECVTIFRHMAQAFSSSTEGELQQVSMQSLIQEVLKAWQQENLDVTVHTHFQSEEIFCELQPLAFSNSLFDLLDNAVEASGMMPTISLRLFSDHKQVVLEVIDAGKGLSAQILSRLGEPFSTDKEHGTGLGVYAAQMAMQSMGGEFELFNNSSGRGATARMIFPQGVFT